MFGLDGIIDDDPTIIAPQMNIWTDSMPAWGRIDPDLPSLPGQPAPVPS